MNMEVDEVPRVKVCCGRGSGWRVQGQLRSSFCRAWVSLTLQLEYRAALQTVVLAAFIGRELDVLHSLYSGATDTERCSPGGSVDV